MNPEDIDDIEEEILELLKAHGLTPDECIRVLRQTLEALKKKDHES